MVQTLAETIGLGNFRVKRPVPSTFPLNQIGTLDLKSCIGWLYIIFEYVCES